MAGGLRSHSDSFPGTHPEAPDCVAAVGVSGQGVAAVLVSRQGKPLRPAVLWLDSRSASEAKELQRCCGERIASVSGKSPAPYNVEPKLLWVKRNEPEPARVRRRPRTGLHSQPLPPRLRSEGIPQEAIEDIMIHNPARASGRRAIPGESST